jgi:integrase
MPRQTTELTDTQIKRTRPHANKDKLLTDGKGLILRIKPSGSRSWLLNYYTPFTKKRTNIGLGGYPAVPLKKARKKRDKYRALIAENIDPKDYRREAAAEAQTSQANTLVIQARKWLELKKPAISLNYHNRIEHSLELYIFPKLGKIPIHNINAPDTIRVIQHLADKGRTETILKLCRWLNEIMVRAVNGGLIHSNPLAGIKHTLTPERHTSVRQPTIKPAELAGFLRDLNRASITPTTLSLIEWLLHTMVRPGEGAGTLWEEIDLAESLWTIPPERMKGRKNPKTPEERRVPHVVPLSSQALQILEFMKPISGTSKYVFPSSRDNDRHANSEAPNMALKRMGYKGKLVAHGLRSLASTTLNEQEFNPDIIEAALAHVDNNSIRGTYNQAEYIEQRRVLMQWWGSHIEEAGTGQKSDKAYKHLKVVSK